MTAIPKGLPVWLLNARELGGIWLKFFAYWAIVDLVLHIAGEQLGWSMFREPRTPGSALFYYAWMAFWFTPIFSRRSRAILGSFRFRAKARSH